MTYHTDDYYVIHGEPCSRRLGLFWTDAADIVAQAGLAEGNRDRCDRVDEAIRDMANRSSVFLAFPADRRGSQYFIEAAENYGLIDVAHAVIVDHLCGQRRMR